MSYVVTTDVVCDVCGDWSEGVSSFKAMPTQARRAVALRGWVVRKGKDLCAQCAESGKLLPKARAI
jgi:hypothetical protein